MSKIRIYDRNGSKWELHVNQFMCSDGLSVTADTSATCSAASQPFNRSRLLNAGASEWRRKAHMKVVMKGAGFFLLLTVALGLAAPGFAQAPEATSSASEAAGKRDRLPQIHEGDGGRRRRDEGPNRDRGPRPLPKGRHLPRGRAGKDKVSLGLPRERRHRPPSTSAKSPASTLRFRSMARPCSTPKIPTLTGNNLASAAPCPSGYLIGWVINPATDRPIKYDGLTGNAVLRESQRRDRVV